VAVKYDELHANRSEARAGQGRWFAGRRRKAVAEVCRWAILLIAACGLFRASAHDVGLSTAEVRCGADKIEVDIVLALKDLGTVLDLDANRDGVVTSAECAANQEAIGHYVTEACLLWVSGETVPPVAVRSAPDETNAIKLSLSFPARRVKTATLRFDLIRDFPDGHRMFVVVVDSAGALIAEQLLTERSAEITFAVGPSANATASSQLPSFVGFIKLGVEHIGTGYDHLLFLFALLLAARDFRSAVVVISFFTLAHSVTLAAATFNLVQVPSRITEPLIAASIVYVGLENILRKGDPHGRWALTFCFGLVHGFGFASVLREMGVGGRAGGVALPLLGFNLGVELGQLAVAAILLPLFWKLRAYPWFASRLVPACSGLVVLLGAYWLVQRVWG
jgi:hydrogenase/urease accessory protein HupE